MFWVRERHQERVWECTAARHQSEHPWFILQSMAASSDTIRLKCKSISLFKYLNLQTSVFPLYYQHHSKMREGVCSYISISRQGQKTAKKNRWPGLWDTLKSKLTWLGFLESYSCGYRHMLICWRFETWLLLSHMLLDFASKVDLSI